MTLDEARRHIGHAVVFRVNPDRPPEQGVITSVNLRYVFVRYGADIGSKATDARWLSPLAPARQP